MQSIATTVGVEVARITVDVVQLRQFLCFTGITVPGKVTHNDVCNLTPTHYQLVCAQHPQI